MHQEDRAEHYYDQSDSREADKSTCQHGDCRCDLRQTNEIAKHHWKVVLDCEALGPRPTEHAEQDRSTVVKKRQSACDSESEEGNVNSCGRALEIHGARPDCTR